MSSWATRRGRLRPGAPRAGVPSVSQSPLLTDASAGLRAYLIHHDSAEKGAPPKAGGARLAPVIQHKGVEMVLVAQGLVQVDLGAAIPVMPPAMRSRDAPRSRAGATFSDSRPGPSGYSGTEQHDLPAQRIPISRCARAARGRGERVYRLGELSLLLRSGSTYFFTSEWSAVSCSDSCTPPARPNRRRLL